MGTPEPDQYLTATLVNGLPTASFAPRSYPRLLRGMVVTNTASSCTANVYVGQLVSVPRATTPLGNNATMSGTIRIPAGQAFWVQWTAAGSNVASATARATLERDDNPLEDSAEGVSWTPQAFTSLTIPSNAGPNDARVEIFGAIPAVLTAYYNAQSADVLGGIIFYAAGGTYFVYIELVIPRPPSVQVAQVTVGSYNGVAVAESFRVRPASAGPSNQAHFDVNSDASGIAGRVFQVAGNQSWIDSTISALQTVINFGPDFTASILNLNTNTQLNINDSSLLRLALGTVFQIDGNDQARGFIGSLGAQADSAAVGAETIIAWTGGATTLNFTAIDGRAYEFEFGWKASSSVANVATYRVRENNVTGTVLTSFPQTLATTNNPPVYQRQVVSRAAGAGNLALILVLTAQASAGTTTLSSTINWPRFFRVRDIGTAAQYPEAIPL